MAGIGTANEQVRDIVEVAFYPVVLDNRHFYVMSVWRRDASTNERLLVDHPFLYGEGYDERADEEPGRLYSVDRGNANVSNCLRFSRDEIDESLENKSWARIGWNAARHADARHADGYVVASVASVQSINIARDHPFESLAAVACEPTQHLRFDSNPYIVGTKGSK